MKDSNNSLLSGSRSGKHHEEFKSEHSAKHGFNSHSDNILEFNNSKDDLLEAVEVPDRFFGSENWKMSSYLSTIIPTFFLSTLVSIVELN